MLRFFAIHALVMAALLLLMILFLW